MSMQEELLLGRGHYCSRQSLEEGIFGLAELEECLLRKGEEEGWREFPGREGV